MARAKKEEVTVESLQAEIANLVKTVENLNKEVAALKKAKPAAGGADPRVDKIWESLLSYDANGFKKRLLK